MKVPLYNFHTVLSTHSRQAWMHCGLERDITISPGDIHFWIYDDVTDNCVLDLQR